MHDVPRKTQIIVGLLPNPGQGAVLFCLHTALNSFSPQSQSCHWWFISSSISGCFPKSRAPGTDPWHYSYPSPQLSICLHKRLIFSPHGDPEGKAQQAICNVLVAMFPEGMCSCCLTAKDPPVTPLVLFGLKGQILPHPMLPDASFPPDHGAWDWLLLEAALASQGWK